MYHAHLNIVIVRFGPLFYSERPRKPRSFKAEMNEPPFWGVIGQVPLAICSISI
jgi:hypothetical protein